MQKRFEKIIVILTILLIIATIIVVGSASHNMQIIEKANLNEEELLDLDDDVVGCDNIEPAAIVTKRAITYQPNSKSAEYHMNQVLEHYNSKFEFKNIETVEEIEDINELNVIENGIVEEDGNNNSTNDANTSENNSNSSDSSNVLSNFVGRFRIPSVGISVACYASSAQSVVDARDSAAYFYCDGHNVIGDHWNQGFDGIKRVAIGGSATFGSTSYKCVARINGHNTGQALTDANYNSISSLYPGTLVCYTCNGNWKNVTIVFFEREGGSQEEVKYDCSSGKHCWGEWEIAWERYESGNYYGWDCRECSICYEEEWVQRTEPSPGMEIPELEETVPTTPDPTDPTEPEEIKPPAPTPTEPTEPTPTEPPVVEPTEPETEPAEPETQPTEPKPTEPSVPNETEPETPKETEPAQTEPTATEPTTPPTEPENVEIPAHDATEPSAEPNAVY